MVKQHCCGQWDNELSPHFIFSSVCREEQQQWQLSASNHPRHLCHLQVMLLRAADLFSPSPSLCCSLLCVLPILFQPFLLHAEMEPIPLTLAQHLFHPLKYPHCFSLRCLQFFCISWDERQETATKNPKCGWAIDLYSSIITFWFILYFLPNTCSCFIFFLLTAETDSHSSTLFFSVKGQPIILYMKWCTQFHIQALWITSHLSTLNSVCHFIT